ncbi:MAG: CHAT domain-containing protein, partial [Planctomycetota bacterium]
DLEGAKAAGDPLRDPAAIDVAASIALGNIVRMEALALDGVAAAARRARAIELEEGALRAAYAANLFDLAAIAGSNAGELYLEAGKTDAAKGFVEWALARARERRLFETEWRCHWYLGRIADAKGETEAADREYAKAEEIIASYRSSILQAERKAGFLTDKVAFYRDLVRRHIRRGSPGGALSAAERAKARALVESLGLRFLAFSDPEATALYREYVLLESRAEKERKSPPGSFLGVGVKPADPAETLEKLSAIRRRWERDLPRGHVLRAFLSGGSVGADEIAREVGPDATLVEYFALDDGYVALLVSEGRVEAVSLPVRPEELARTAGAFARGWADDPVAAKKLFGWLVRPIQDRIRGRKLFIVPHGPLYQVPFEALIDDAARDPRDPGAPAYLLRRFEVAYLPSASWKPLLREARPGGAEDLSLFAVQDPWTDYDGDGRPDLPPLAQAKEEVASLSPYFSERVVLSGLEATKATVRERAGFADVVHYACHGEFRPQRPWESSLFLAPPAGAKGGDGRLTAAEVLGLDLRRSRLVALSGCETGRGRVLPGDDTVSVSTAFLHAGARALLVSLWKVEDRATALLMASFYRKWLGEGRDKARSLREAKLELVAGEFSRPRFWSAFVLMGEP